MMLFPDGLSLGGWWLGQRPLNGYAALSRRSLTGDRLRKVGVGPPPPGGHQAALKEGFAVYPSNATRYEDHGRGWGGQVARTAFARLKWDHLGRTGSSCSIRQGRRVNRHV